MDYGQALTDLRKKMGWSQAELAERLGITQKAVSALETGENRSPNRANAAKINDLLCEQGIMPQPSASLDSISQLIQAIDGFTAGAMDGDVNYKHANQVLLAFIKLQGEHVDSLQDEIGMQKVVIHRLTEENNRLSTENKRLSTAQYGGEKSVGLA
ncbi:MAG: helix-turn-helix domain-containing protein [Chitinispirillia bacterium]|nr:helix-turn-helix domain-containing protein [Chitinispirillia bacterium]